MQNYVEIALLTMYFHYFAIIYPWRRARPIISDRILELSLVETNWPCGLEGEENVKDRQRITGDKAHLRCENNN